MNLTKEQQLDLLNKSKAGDINARNELCYSFYDYITAICKNKCKNKKVLDHEDFVSECFIKILKSINNHNPETASFKTFIYMNVSNHIKDISHRYHGGPHRRMKNREERPYISNFTSCSIEQNSDFINNSKVYNPNLPKEIDEKDIISKISRNLKKEDKDALKSHLNDGKKISEIGNTVYKRIMRLLRRDSLKYQNYLD